MKLALALFALSSAALAQTQSIQVPPPKAAASAAGVAAPSAVPSTIPSHNGSPLKNPASTLPKVVGLPHTLYSLKYIDIKIGTGPLAEPRKFYTVNYTGWFPDGTKFDSSYDHQPKEPIVFPYGAQRVIIGWDTGFEGMHVGGKRRLFVPYQLAYGLVGRPPKMPAKANLIFDVELVSFSDKPPTPPAPVAPRAPSTPPTGANGAPAPPAPGQPPQPAAPAAASPAPAPAAPPASSAPTAPAKPPTRPD